MSMVLTISLIGPELCEGDGEVRAGCEEFSATNISGHEASERKQSVLIFS